MSNRFIFVAQCLLVCASVPFARYASAEDKPATPADGEHKVIFSNGHDTIPEDRGRPVILVANALGVKPEVFREVFKGVHPAGPGSGGPTPDEARANKRVLLDGLSKYGVTNERLDEVSNYYRYPPGGNRNGRIWKHRDAAAVAMVKDGKITGFKITDAGAGYSSPPDITVEGIPDVHVMAEVTYGKDLATNGQIASLSTGGATTQP